MKGNNIMKKLEYTNIIKATRQDKLCKELKKEYEKLQDKYDIEVQYSTTIDEVGSIIFSVLIMGFTKDVEIKISRFDDYDKENGYPNV